MKKYILFIILLMIISPVNSENIREDDAHLINIDIKGSLQNPSFSQDGNSIVFTNYKNGYNKGPSDLYIFNINTEELKLLVSDGSDNVDLPGNIWINNKIIFSSSREPHDEIYMISADGNPGDEIKITQRDDLVAYEPSFSSDGEWIVFESHELDVDDDGIIVKYRIDGTSQYIELTDRTDNAKQPNFSPVDDLIVFQKYTDDKWDLWLINGDGSEEHKLTNSVGSNTDASFSANGEWVIYSREIPETDYANLYRITLDGNIDEKLTVYPGYDGAASYLHPFVVFETYEGDPDRSDGTTIWIRDITKELTVTLNIDEAKTFSPAIIPILIFTILVKKYKNHFY